MFDYRLLSVKVICQFLCKVNFLHVSPVLCNWWIKVCSSFEKEKETQEEY